MMVERAIAGCANGAISERCGLTLNWHQSGVTSFGSCMASRLKNTMPCLKLKEVSARFAVVLLDGCSLTLTIVMSLIACAVCFVVVATTRSLPLSGGQTGWSVR